MNDNNQDKISPIKKFAEFLQFEFHKVFFVYFLAVLVTGALFLKLEWLNLLGLLTFLVMALLGAELILRIVLFLAFGKGYRYAIFPYAFKNHPEYGYVLRPGAKFKEYSGFLFDRFLFMPGADRLLNKSENQEKRVQFTVNSLGFRGSEFNPEEKSARLRIFCTGGSTTACDSNHDDETWPHQLEEELKKAGYDVEVINAGVQGWFSFPEVKRFEEEISKYQADILLMHQGWNEEFEYSSLNLGKKWHPQVARNAIEENFLYCQPSRFLSQDKILSLHLLLRYYFKQFVFKKNMSFLNPKRWGVLALKEYILGWYDNMVRIARLAQQENISVYTLDYPGLVSLSDSKEERQVYIDNSRLDSWYANYQAISKERITETLKTMCSVIPNLDVCTDFKEVSGEKRLELFHDEIHMTPKGNKMLAECIAKKLIADGHFQKLYNSKEKMTNLGFENNEVLDIRHSIGQNSSRLAKFLDSIRIKVVQYKNKNKKEDSIPEDRYTTF